MRSAAVISILWLLKARLIEGQFLLPGQEEVPQTKEEQEKVWESIETGLYQSLKIGDFAQYKTVRETRRAQRL